MKSSFACDASACTKTRFLFFAVHCKRSAAVWIELFLFPLIWPSSEHDKEDIFPRSVHLLPEDKYWGSSNLFLIKVHSNFSPIPLQAQQPALQETPCCLVQEGWDGSLVGTCTLVAPKCSIHQQQTLRPLFQSTTLLPKGPVWLSFHQNTSDVSGSMRKSLPFQSQSRHWHGMSKAIKSKLTCNQPAFNMLLV